MLDRWNSDHSDAEDWMPAEVEEISRDQARRILKESLYDRHRLAEIEDDRLARQLLDMYTTHPPRAVHEIVQAAVDEVMRRNRLYGGRERPFRRTDPVGPRTRARLNWLVEGGYGVELREALARGRQAYLDRYAGRFTGSGWARRIRSFAEPAGAGE